MRLAVMSGVFGLTGVLAGSGVSYYLNERQLDAQTAQLEQTTEQEQVSFLRDRRIVVYSELIDIYDKVRALLLNEIMTSKKLSDRATERAFGAMREARVLLDRANELSVQAQLLGPSQVSLDIHSANQDYGFAMAAAKGLLNGRQDITYADAYRRWSSGVAYRDKFVEGAREVVGTDLQ